MQHVFKKALSLRLLNFIITNINGKKIVSNELRLVSEVMRVQIFVFSFFNGVITMLDSTTIIENLNYIFFCIIFLSILLTLRHPVMNLPAIAHVGVMKLISMHYSLH